MFQDSGDDQTVFLRRKTDGNLLEKIRQARETGTSLGNETPVGQADRDDRRSSPAPDATWRERVPSRLSDNSASVDRSRGQSPEHGYTSRHGDRVHQDTSSSQRGRTMTSAVLDGQFNQPGAATNADKRSRRGVDGDKDSTDRRTGARDSSNGSKDSHRRREPNKETDLDMLKQNHGKLDGVSRKRPGRNPQEAVLTKDWMKQTPVLISLPDETGKRQKHKQSPDQTEFWQNHKTLSECNHHMLTYELGCDVTFLVGEGQQTVKAHTYMLISRSAEMHALLQRHKPEDPDMTYEVPVSDVTLPIFRQLLKFIYTEEIKIDNAHVARALIEAAAVYGPDTLADRCFRYLLTEMSSDNVCITLELAHGHSRDDVYTRCFQFINVNAVDVLSADDFPRLCRQCVEDIVKSDRLNSDEISVYMALVRWGENECASESTEPSRENLRHALGPLLYHVRFPIISPRHFTERLSTHCILPPDEKIALYQYYHGDNYALPEQFNENQRKKYHVKEFVAVRGNGQKIKDSPEIKRPQPETPRSDDGNASPGEGEEEETDYNLPMRRLLRFQGVSGPWLLKGLDAISFRCTCTVILRGVQVLGPYTGTDTYRARLVVLDDTMREIRREETTLVADDTAVRMYDVRLLNKVRVPANTVFTVGVRLLDGIPTYQGTQGMSVVQSGDVKFEFFNSSHSYNGTDVTVGQIPGLLYSVPLE